LEVVEKALEVLENPLEVLRKAIEKPVGKYFSLINSLFSRSEA